jgi:anti-anti-sigma regulatory factor
MVTAAQRPTVQLRLQGAGGDDEIVAIRRQLAACLCGGAIRVSVMLRDQPDVDLAVLRALNGVAEYLHRHGGALTLVGAGPGVVTKIAVHGLTRLSETAASQQEEHE